MHQGAAHKYRLLLKLLFSRPSEFLDRVKTAAEGMASPPQSAAGAEGLDLPSMLDLSSKYLGMDLSGFLNDPGAVAIREHIASERALLDRPESAARHDADEGLSDFCYVICRALRPRSSNKNRPESGQQPARALSQVPARIQRCTHKSHLG